MFVLTGPVPPRRRMSWFISLEEHTSLSHWYTSIAVVLETPASLCASVTAYCLHHQYSRTRIVWRDTRVLSKNVSPFKKRSLSKCGGLPAWCSSTPPPINDPIIIIILLFVIYYPMEIIVIYIIPLLLLYYRNILSH